jgi:ABC-type Fe3+-hydroxamate transport system substrate-binding protein
MRRMGELLGTAKEAERASGSLVSRMSAASSDAGRRRETPLRVFIQISEEPLFTVGRDSYLTEVVRQAGGLSVTRDVPTGYPTLSKETAAALDPEVIFISDSQDNREPNAVFRNSSAVRAGRVYRINADIISRPGPRLVDALEEIAAKLREGN